MINIEAEIWKIENGIVKEIKYNNNIYSFYKEVLEASADSSVAVKTSKPGLLDKKIMVVLDEMDYSKEFTIFDLVALKGIENKHPYYREYYQYAYNQLKDLIRENKIEKIVRGRRMFFKKVPVKLVEDLKYKSGLLR